MGLLPTTRSAPITELGRYSILLYGATKAGKTTLAAGSPDAVFLSCERGAQALGVYELPIPDWPTLVAAVEELRQSKRFATVVIDTIDLAWRYCQDAYLRKIGKDVEPDDYGRTASRIKSEFHRVLAQLAAQPRGLVLISHQTEREVKSRTGSYHIITPSLPSAPREIVQGMCDLILYLEVAPEMRDGAPTGQVLRRLRTKPSATYDAGDRTGRLSDPVPATYAALAADLTRALSECAAVATPQPEPAKAPTLPPVEATAPIPDPAPSQEAVSAPEKPAAPIVPPPMDPTPKPRRRR